MLHHCPECGAPLASDALDGSCPACTLAIGLIPAAAVGQPCDFATLFDPVPAKPTISYFGDYELLEEIGRGGMGIVYRARQVSLNRIVAIKTIAAEGLASELAVRRFREEARNAAHLKHPSIVAIHEVGEHAGRHYFSMDFIKGEDLGQRVRTAPLAVRDAVALLRTTAEAVHFAHERGLIHRDLKPSNVLVDAAGQPHVTDFGLAKRVAGVEPGFELTLTGQVLGTPGFISPEQAAGQSQIDRRADIYSLGAILFHLITGRPPFQEETPQKTIAAAMNSEPVSPRSICQELPRDVETICLKCLEMDPAKRYPTAQALADELGRFLRDEPIHARPVSVPEKAWRWSRRNPGMAALAAVLLFVLLATAVGSSLAALRFAEQRRVAEAKEGESRRSLARLKVTEGWRRVEGGDNFSAVRLFTEAHLLERSDSGRATLHQRRLAIARHGSPELVQMFFPGGPLQRIELSPDGRRVLTVTAVADHRSGPATAQVWDWVSGRPLTGRMEHSNLITRATFSLDGRKILTGSADRTARIWNAATGLPITPPLLHSSPVTHAAFSSDGSLVATCASSGSDQEFGYFALWDVDTGRQRSLRKSSGMDAVFTLFTPDSDEFLVGSRTFLANFWKLSTNTWKRTRNVPSCWETYSAAFSEDRRFLVIAGTFGLARQPGAQVFDAPTLRQVSGVLVHPDGAARVAAFSPDAHRVVTAGPQNARVWEVAGGEAVTPWMRHDGPIVSANFSADGGHLLTASSDHTARVWDAETGALVLPPLRHGAAVCGAYFTPDGQHVLTGSADGSVRVWRLAPAHSASLVWLAGNDLSGARFSADGARLFTADVGGMVGLWDAKTGRPIGDPLLQPPGVLASPNRLDGRQSLTLAREVRLQGWELSNGTVKFLLPQQMVMAGQPRWPLIPDAAPLPAGLVLGISGSFSADGRRVLVSHFDLAARLWDVTTGLPLTPWFSDHLPTNRHETTHQATLSPDGRWAVTAHRSGFVYVWNATNATIVAGPLRHENSVDDAIFSGDGEWLATQSGPAARVWRTRTGEAAGPSLLHQGAVRDLAFSADARLLLTASDDGTAQVWEPTTGRKLAGFPHQGPVREAAFSPDGSLVATASFDGTARVWDMASGEPVTPPLIHADKVLTVSWHPGGKFLLTASADQTARVWPLPEESADITSLAARALLLGGVLPSGAPPLTLEEAWKLMRPGGENQNLLTMAATAQTGSRFLARPRELALALQAVSVAEAQADWRKAVMLFTRLTELEPARWQFYYRRGRAHTLLGHWAEAEKDFHRAVQIEPAAAVAWVRRYVIRQRLGDTNGAASDLARAVERAEHFRTALDELAPGKTSDYSTPAQWAELASDCSLELGTNRQAGAALAARGMAGGTQTIWEQSFRDLRAAGALQSDNAAVWAALARIYGRLKSWERVTNAVTHATALQPDDYRSIFVRAEAWGHLNRPADALSDYARVMELNGDGAAVRRAVAQLYVVQERWPEAVSNLALRVVFAPEDADSLNQLAWMLVNGPAEIRDPARALAFAERALAVPPTHARYFRTRGVARYRLGQFEAALRDFEHAAQREAGQATSATLFGLALAHHGLNHAPEARANYQRALTRWQDERARLPKLDDLSAEAELTLRPR